MERQKPRAGRAIDGFSRVPPRLHYYLDGLSAGPRPVPRPAQASPANQVLPALKPRPIPYPAQQIQTAIPPQQPVQLGINRDTQMATVNQFKHLEDEIAPNRPNKALTGQQIGSSILGASLPPTNFSRIQPAPKKHRFSFKPRKVLKYSSLTAGAFVIAFGIWFGSSIIGNLDKLFHGNVFSDAHALISGSTLKESGGRINILLAGDSVGDPGHAGASLADSIMVISINPKTQKGFILSIPRDLWVHIPSLGHQKINAANDVLNFHQQGLPSGGMGQLQQIVQTDLGIPIDYEALIDYTAFRDAVNAVGGINISIHSPDPRGMYDSFTHLKLPNGNVNLTGQEALDLARARGDSVAGDISYGIPSSDFTRTMYQREMLKALFKKALTVGVMSNPIKISSLMNAIGNNIETNLTLGDVMSLIHVTNGLNLNNMHSETYSFGGAGSLLTSYTDPVSHQEALIPSAGIDNFSQLRAFYQQLTSSNPVAQEAPTVTLLNGSNVSGLASREQKILESEGFDVTTIADAAAEYPSTMIVDNSNESKPQAATLLEKDIKGSVVNSSNNTTEAQEASNYSTNFVVIMGKDWDNTGTTGTPIQN
jgi:LCP family protein required for cell wall assembly